MCRRACRATGAAAAMMMMATLRAISESESAGVGGGFSRFGIGSLQFKKSVTRLADAR
jgi:hypothetical protein